jgi:ATP-dependent Clp protease adapter protein ClpS
MPRRSTKKKLYLLDDNHNSFRHVVFCLANLIPDYNIIRAEQVAQITHYKGRSCIMTGTESELMRYYIALRKKDLYVELI